MAIDNNIPMEENFTQNKFHKKVCEEKKLLREKN